MSAVREHLAEVIRKKVDAHGTVVWEDPEREYADVAETVPPGATFVRWDGSWYALRRELEELVNGPTAPRLVIYQPIETPREDPLAEIRQAGTVLRHRLGTLVRDALAGTFTQNRIAELAHGSRTLLEVEAALTGAGQIGVQLPAALARLTRSSSLSASLPTSDWALYPMRRCGAKLCRCSVGSSVCPRST